MMEDAGPSLIAGNLERLHVLRQEGRAHLAELTEKALLLKPHRKLIDEHRPCDHLFIVKSGWLSEYRQLRDGRRQILNFRLPGEVAGIECLIYRTALHSTAALTACEVAPVSRVAFEHMQNDFPKLAAAFLLAALRDGAIAHEWAVNLGRRAAFPRIAHLLLELERRLRSAGMPWQARVPFPLKQQDIADCTGLTTPYVNRVLQQMRKQGLVCLSEGALEIRDCDALARAAGFRPDYLQGATPLGGSPLSLRDAPVNGHAAPVMPTGSPDAGAIV